MTAPSRTTRRYVTRRNPCAVCGATDGCSRERDVDGDGLILCRKRRGPQPGYVYLGQSPRDDQWALYRSETDPVIIERERIRRDEWDRSRRNGHTHGPTSWRSRAARYASQMTPDGLGELADHLGLPVSALLTMPLIGWCPDDDHGPCWTFPEHDERGEVVGIVRRYCNGKKVAMAGSSRGLILPTGWREREGPVYVCEGHTTTLAATALGLAAIGRPSNTGGVGLLAGLLAGVPAAQHIVVVGEWDAKDDGTWPGRDGAISTAAQLRDLLRRDVMWTMPPDKAKDVRTWTRSRGLDPTVLHEWQEAGQEIAAKLREGMRTPAGHQPGKASNSTATDGEDWPDPITLDSASVVPPFPTDALPSWLRKWVEAEAEATQTPPDLAGMLALAICGAGLAGKYRVEVRPGWTEPTNIYTVTALPPGERKSAVFSDAIRPVQEIEAKLLEEALPKIAEAEAELRVLEAQQKKAEGEASKAEEDGKRISLMLRVRDKARLVAAHKIPTKPRLYVDDETPENLARTLAAQGGRLLQAGPEGTPFEIIKGRYSESANFDVYLKGHAGDSLRVGRVTRDEDIVDKPALSLALAVQPDVIQGLADDASLRGKGFLARLLYSVPRSIVGKRKVSPAPVPATVATGYVEGVKALWNLKGGAEGPMLLSFSREADGALQDLERWIEPQLAPGEDLSLTAGWAGKLAGAVARIAGILHVAASIEESSRISTTIDVQTVQAAIRIGKAYLLPHAQAALDLMEADPRMEGARAVWRTICSHIGSAYSAHSAYGPPTVTRRDVHNLNRRRFQKAEQLDPIIEVLVDRYFLRGNDASGRPGRGHKSPQYTVNPKALEESR